MLANTNQFFDMNEYGIQVWYNDEWIWVTHSVADKDTAHRVISTFSSQEEAEKIVDLWKDQYTKIRIVRLDEVGLL